MRCCIIEMHDMLYHGVVPYILASHIVVSLMSHLHLRVMSQIRLHLRKWVKLHIDIWVTHLIGKLKFVGIIRRYMSYVTHTHVIHVIYTHMSHARTYAWVLPHINVWVMWPINIWLMWPLSLRHSSSLLSHTEIYKSCYTRYISHVTHTITIRCIHLRHTYMYVSCHTYTQWSCDKQTYESLTSAFSRPSLWAWHIDQ